MHVPVTSSVPTTGILAIKQRLYGSLPAGLEECRPKLVGSLFSAPTVALTNNSTMLVLAATGSIVGR